MSETATAEKLDETIEDQSTEVEIEKATPPGISRFGEQAEHNQNWRLNVPINVSPEQCMDEGFWAHIAIRLRPGDEIHVMPDNMAWELVLHVIDAGKAYAHVTKKSFFILATRENQVRIPSIYKIDYAGTTHKYRVIRDGKDLKDGFATEALARRWAANHEAAVTR